MTNGAHFSPCGKYRYLLWRVWGEEVRQAWRWCNFLMLNPSTADAEKNDPTVERCEQRARLLGYDGLLVTNLFAMKSTDPRALYEAEDPVGPKNNAVIVRASKTSEIVICAWGNHGSILQRAGAVMQLLEGRDLHALKICKTGHPSHPLYLPYNTQPIIYQRSKAHAARP